MSKNLYHSELVREGECEITLKSKEPQQSKFQGKPDYFVIVYGGEERYYPVENEEIVAELSGRSGQRLNCRFSGRGTDARVEILGDAQDDPPPQRQQRQPPRNDPPPRQQTQQTRQQERAPTAAEKKEKEAQTFKHANVLGARCAILMRLALRKARAVLEKEMPGNYSSEDLRAMTNTLFIELKGLVDVRTMPVEWPQDAPPPQRQREPEPPPEPALPEEDDSDSIPF